MVILSNQNQTQQSYSLQMNHSKNNCTQILFSLVNKRPYFTSTDSSANLKEKVKISSAYRQTSEMTVSYQIKRW